MKKRLFAGVFGLAIALVLGVAVRASMAQFPAALTVYSSNGTGMCDGKPVPMVEQGETIGIQLAGFHQREMVKMSVRFPDDRIFSLYQATTLDGEMPLPVGKESNILTDVDGGAYFDYPTNLSWPTAPNEGCYTITAHGKSSNHQATGKVQVIQQQREDLNPGPFTVLQVLGDDFGHTMARQGDLVNIYGEGFGASETVEILAISPHGIVMNFPEQKTNQIGGFHTSFRFSESNSVGTYTFIAKGISSTYSTSTTFTLNPEQINNEGWAQIVVSFPTKGTQKTTFEIQGRQFRPNESIRMEMVLPDLSIRELPLQFADQWGNFSTNVHLDEQLPTGVYLFSAEGEQSERMATASLTLEPVDVPTPVPEPQTPTVWGSSIYTDTDASDPANDGDTATPTPAVTIPMTATGQAAPTPVGQTVEPTPTTQSWNTGVVTSTDTNPSPSPVTIVTMTPTQTPMVMWKGGK